jgi:hypothetical protein
MYGIFLGILVFIFIIIIILKGPHRHAWPTYSEIEIRALKEARKNLGDYKIKKYKKGERGKILYQYGFNSSRYNGLAIYENCLHADFYFVKYGYYEYIGYDDINKITLISYHKDNLTNSLIEYLQLDTVDYKVHILEFDEHPKDHIIALLKERFGKRWNEIYSEEYKGIDYKILGKHHANDEIIKKM